MNIFFQLALVLSLSSLIGYVVLRLKLPLVVAYLLAGLVLSLVALFDPNNSLVLEILPEIGIAFVLFLIGMELDLREIKALGVPIITAALGQIIISTFAGYAIAGALGFTQTESFYLGLGIAFSSTVVVIKMLLEKRDLASLYGKLSVGILLVEDLVAIAVLMSISVSNSALHLGLQQSLPLLAIIVKATGLFLLTFFLSRYVLERIFDSVAKNVELLFLTAITWCFIFTSLAITLGFSVVIGAFLAGVALASSPYHLQIQGKIKPLRDFFVTLFFVYLGTQAKLDDLFKYWPAIIILTLFTLLAKPLIYLLILGIFGFRKHTMFQTALNLSQVSEFSLVVMLVGLKMNLISSPVLSVIAVVAVLSIILSSIMIAYSKRLYIVFAPLIRFFEHKSKIHVLELKIEETLQDHVIVIGAHRVGGPVVRFLSRSEIPFMVMDFNPHVVEALREKGIKVVYGDVGDPEVLDSLQLQNAKLIICTATDMGDNEILLEECKRKKVRAKVVCRALDHDHADALKALGADYVILPEKVSGDFLVNQLKQHWPNIHFSGLD
ncbi:cation:proton antiporter [Candidatus Daviesbacteria bacterium]|nr:cation:proton antiporter [Candidatus Daviesbacteria bacterium]